MPAEETSDTESGVLASGQWRSTVRLPLVAEADAVRQARRRIADEVAVNEPGLRDDAELVASELLANATQHGAPPVTIQVLVGEGRVRIEVHDGGAQLPVRAWNSVDSMTGRGLMLVDQASERWGVRVETEGGKTVWAEISVGSSDAPAETDIDADALLAAWDDGLLPAERFTVVLGDVPTDLLIAAKTHIENLVREFSLAAASAAAGGEGVPPHLAQLIDTVVHGFGEARAAIKRQAIAAAERGDPRTRLTLSLPLSAADAGEAYLAALDEADNYARAARLLTLETPPQHRVFRQWYVANVIEQLRTQASGRPAPAPVGFEERLLQEVEALSSAQQLSDQVARLQTVTAALARASTPEDVASVVVIEGVAALGASGGSLLMIAEDGQHLAVPGAVGYASELIEQLAAEPIDAPLPAATALQTGEAVWIESRAERDERFPGLKGLEPGTVGMCALPLHIAGHQLGALRFSFDAPRLFDEDERRFARALAAQTAYALERSALYDAERLARSAAETLARRLSRLAGVTAKLAAAADLTTIADAVISEAAEALDARVATLSVRFRDQLTVVGMRGARPESQDRWATHSIDEDLPAAEAVRTGETIMVAGSDAIAERWKVFEDLIPEERSLVCIPLIAEGLSLGVISLMFLGTRLPEDSEMTFLTALADTCAQSLHRLRITADAELSATRLRFLADASAELARSLDYRTTLSRVARLAVPALADWCVIEMLDENGQLQTLVAQHVDAHKLELALELQRRYPPNMNAAQGSANVVRTGASELIEEIPDEMLVQATRDEEHLRLARELQLRSAMVVPLTARGRILGALTLIYADSGRKYQPADISFAEDLARRAAAAIDNAHLFSEIRDASVRLQRALLPVVVPTVEGWEVAAHYGPAGEQSEVGGDWYDAIRLDDGRLVAVIGDVMGRGVAAAAAMAQMRSSIRAYATVDPEPVAVLAKLDNMFEALELSQLVTVFYALVDTTTGEMRVASAGHLPPLVLARGQAALPVELPIGVALGAGGDVRVATTVQLPRGGVMVAYTDGLVERRGEDIDVGLAVLAERVTAAADLPPHELVATLVAAAGDTAEHDDDVTVLALRRA